MSLFAFVIETLEKRDLKKKQNYIGLKSRRILGALARKEGLQLMSAKFTKENFGQILSFLQHDISWFILSTDIQQIL